MLEYGSQYIAIPATFTKVPNTKRATVSLQFMSKSTFYVNNLIALLGGRMKLCVES